MRIGFVLFISMILLIAGVSFAQQRQDENPPTRIMPKNDIAVTQIAADNSWFLVVTFENRGNVEINATLKYKIWVNGVLKGDASMLFDHFGAGKSRTHKFSGGPDPIITINGAATVRVKIGTVPAWEEPLRNNTLEKMVICPPSFDIAVTDIYTDKDCILWVKFENLGKSRIHTRLHYKLFINDELVRNEEILFDDFKPGTWRTHGYPGGNPIKILAPATVVFWIDDTHKLPETNERNSLEKRLPGCQG